MPAGIVLADIDAGYAAAEFPLVFVFDHGQRPAGQYGNQSIVDTSGMPDAQIGKIDFFRACFHLDAEPARDLSNTPRQHPHLRFIRRSHTKTGHPGVDMTIHINKADDAFLCMPGQPLCHIAEVIHMIVDINILGQQDRIVTPDDSLFSDFIGKSEKRVDDFRLRRQVRFKVRAVRRQGELKIKGEGVEQGKPLKHWGRIFGPEDKAIDIRRRKRNLSDLFGIHGVAHLRVPLAKPVKKPAAVKRGNVRTPAAADDHVDSPLKNAPAGSEIRSGFCTKRRAVERTHQKALSI